MRLTREAFELTMVAKAAERRELSELLRLRQILAEIPVEDESPEYARLDVEFPLEIGRLSGNTVMMELLSVLLAQVRPHLDQIHWSDNRRAESNELYARIYSALAAGDADPGLGRAPQRDAEAAAAVEGGLVVLLGIAPVADLVEERFVGDLQQLGRL